MKPVNWHNAHLGSLGIVACNGPSFADVDASSLVGPGRVVIGVNNTYPKLRPDYWVGVDEAGNFDAKLWWEAFPKITIAGRDGDMFHGERLKDRNGAHFLDIGKDGNFWDWSEGSKFYWSRNSFLIALQLGLWMGIRDFAFVGVDLSHEKGHYADGNYLQPQQLRENALLHDQTIQFFRDFIPQAATCGVSCVSCSPVSRLNGIIPHIPLPEVLATIESPIPSGRAFRHNTDGKPCCKPGEICFDSIQKQDVLAMLGKPVERNVVLILRSGGDFKPEHVTRLVGQLKDCAVTVLTDFPASEFTGVNVMPLHYGWPGWWSKMELFRPSLLKDKPFLYLDLDTTVRDRLPDEFFTNPETVLLARFRDEYADGTKPIQCGMMLLQPKDRKAVWSTWTQGPERFMRELRGDDDFWHHHGPACRTWQDLFPGMVTSYRFNWLPGLDKNGTALNKDAVKVLCFFGNPRPWEVSVE